MTNTIQTGVPSVDQWLENYQAQIDELTYRSYKFNRQNAPEISPDRWVRVYGTDALFMEDRLRREKAMSDPTFRINEDGGADR